MNVWQYSRWVYLIGRSIKNKSLEPSEREAFINFIDGILKTRPMILQRLKIKKGNTYKVLLEQNDYSLGKMVQVIGRDLKVFLMKKEEKILCDRFFFSTDKRRFMTYNDYQALDGKNVFVSEDENLAEIVSNCTPYSVIILSDGNYNFNLDISVEGTKIKSEENAIINGNITISTDDIVVENVTIKSETPIVIKSEDTINLISFNNTNIETCVEIKSEVKDFNLTNSSIYGGDSAITFESIGENINIENCFINGSIEFKDTLINSSISNNTIVAENGIVLNGENDENITINGNKFNVE